MTTIAKFQQTNKKQPITFEYLAGECVDVM